MTDRELMQQALEALLEVNYDQAYAKEVTALRERLAQPEQEPVWIQPNHLQKARQAPFLCRVEPKQRDDFVPLYTAPPASKPWVGLVWGELPEDGHNHDFLRGAAWAEAKLKEKNA